MDELVFEVERVEVDVLALFLDCVLFAADILSFAHRIYFYLFVTGL
jgi:hypothetical protein